MARRNRAIRRPAARRAVGRLRLLLRTARGRGARTQCGRQDTVAERTLIMPHRFPLAIRLLHWTMALLIIAMLFIGAGMVSTADPAYASLIDRTSTRLNSSN